MKMRKIFYLFLIYSFVNLNAQEQNSDLKIQNMYSGIKFSYALSNSCQESPIGAIEFKEDASLNHKFGLGGILGFDFFNKYGFRTEFFLSYEKENNEFNFIGNKNLRSVHNYSTVKFSAPLLFLLPLDFGTKSIEWKFNLGVSPCFILKEENELENNPSSIENEKIEKIKSDFQHSRFSIGTAIGIEAHSQNFIYGLDIIQSNLWLSEAINSRLGVRFSIAYKFGHREEKKPPRPPRSSPSPEVLILRSHEYKVDNDNLLIENVPHKATDEEIRDLLYVKRGYRIEFSKYSRYVIVFKDDQYISEYKLIRNKPLHLITSSVYNVRHKSKQIKEIPFFMNDDAFFENIEIEPNYYGRIERSDSSFMNIKGGDTLRIYTKENQLVEQYILRTRPLLLNNLTNDARIEMDDSTIRVTNFKKVVVEDLEKSLIKNDFIQLHVTDKNDRVLESTEVITDNSLIYIISKRNKKILKVYKFRTRFYIPEEGQTVRVLDTLDINIVKIICLDNILYHVNTNRFKDIALPDLMSLYKLMDIFPSLKINIISHSSYDGDSQKNMELSIKRAQAVVDYLVEKNIDLNRMTSFGKGDTEPYKVTHSKLKIFDFLELNAVLNEEYINEHYNEEEAEIARQLSRRTEIEFIK